MPRFKPAVSRVNAAHVRRLALAAVVACGALTGGCGGGKTRGGATTCREYQLLAPELQAKVGDAWLQEPESPVSGDYLRRRGLKPSGLADYVCSRAAPEQTLDQAIREVPRPTDAGPAPSSPPG